MCLCCQEQGSILREARDRAAAVQQEDPAAAEPHDLRRHPPQLPRALLRPRGGGHGPHPQERGQHGQVSTVHLRR